MGASARIPITDHVAERQTHDERSEEKLNLRAPIPPRASGMLPRSGIIDTSHAPHPTAQPLWMFFLTYYPYLG